MRMNVLIAVFKMGRDILYNKNNHPFVINRQFTRDSNAYYEIEFLETGSVREVRKSVVDSGMVKDRYAKDVCGVACIGNAKKVDNLKEYTMWKNMVERCYNIKNNHFNTYGGRGVHICERWLCFEYFLEDLPKVECYNRELFYKGELQLDKDKKQLNVKKKVYSLESCIFLSPKENHSMRETPKVVEKSVKVKCIAIDKDGNRFFVNHIPSFARDNNLKPYQIYRCINKIRKTHKGWRFEVWE